MVDKCSICGKNIEDEKYHAINVFIRNFCDHGKYETDDAHIVGNKCYYSYDNYEDEEIVCSPECYVNAMLNIQNKYKQFINEESEISIDEIDNYDFFNGFVSFINKL